MKKILVTIALNDFELDKILPAGTPKAGVRRAKIATDVCTTIVRNFIEGIGQKEEPKQNQELKDPELPELSKLPKLKNPKDADAPKEEHAAKVEEAPKKTAIKKTPAKKTSKK